MTAAPPDVPPAAAGTPRRENVFTHKLGPLPTWAWIAIAAAILVAWRVYSGKKAAAAQQQSAASQSTPSDQVPQFVNQTYVSTTAPSAQDTGQAAPPVNPSPVGGAVQPKPTTTTPQKLACVA